MATTDRDSLVSTLEDGLIHPSNNVNTIETNTPSIQIGLAQNFGDKICLQGETIQCRIFRRKDKGKMVYELYLEDSGVLKFLYTGYKSDHYYITNNKIGYRDSPILAKLKHNFIGTQFVLFQSEKSRDDDQNLRNQRKELCAIMYDTNILGLKGPRKMTVLLNSISKSSHNTPSEENDDTLSQRLQNSDHSVIKVGNKDPQWNSESHSFVLNFQGRVTLPSIKNFQIVHPMDPDYIVLQFGKVDRNVFTCDLKFPLSPMVAFAIALSSFHEKLACE